MPAPVFKVEGGRELRRTLKAAEVDLADLKDAHQRAADVVTPVARSEAPVGLTGRLAGSVRSGSTRTAALIRAGGAGVPYAGVQEFGWPARNIPASPYIVPAAKQTQPTWVGVYQRAVEAILAKVKGAP